MASLDPLDAALAALQEGRPSEAIAILEGVLARDPGHAEALHLAGVAALRSGDAGQAVMRLREASVRAPRVPMVWTHLGLALAAQGDAAGALASHEKALRLDPGHPIVKLNRSVALRDAGRLEESLAAARQAAMLMPNSAEAARAVGDTLFAMGRAREALEAYDRALAADGGNAFAHHNRGTALYRLGNAMAAAGEFREAIHLDPAMAGAHEHLAFVLCDLGEPAEAVECARRAAALEPRNPRILASLAFALDLSGDVSAALACCDEAIAIDAGCPTAWTQRAASLAAAGSDAQAQAAHERAVAVDPGHARSLVNRLHLKQKLCDWRGHALVSRWIVEQVAAGADCPPFALLHIDSTPSLQRLCSERHAQSYLPPPKPRFAKTRGDRIHVAYLSADFRDHPVAERIAPVLEHHDRSRFTVTALSFGPVANDVVRERVRKACDRFEQLDAASDADIASLARRMGVDIAVDLMGYTERARPGIFAHRAAPAQAQYLGFPGTMGLASMDFLIADATVIPQAEDAHYTERVIRLPASYQANDAVTSAPAANRAALGLPQDAFVFCCFNDRLKITPEAFAAWMKILRGAPGSILWLVDGGAIATDNLRAEARTAGIDPARLHFAPRVSLDQHIARCAAADLALDALPYSGHATTSDMLRAGVPVVTLLGNTFAGRVAASLLRAVAVPDLIASSLAGYESLAIELANDRARLAGIRERVDRNRATEPLFDIARFTRGLEAAYETMLGDS